MALSEEDKKINKIFRKTKKAMESLEVYQKEFDPVIKAYARVRYQHDIINAKWEESGMEITEEYTNKNGSMNRRKTAEYQALETIRRDLLNYENVLGLTPIGLKKIKQKALKKRGKSKLIEGINDCDS